MVQGVAISILRLLSFVEFTLERNEGLRTGSMEFILSLSKGYSQ